MGWISERAHRTGHGLNGSGKNGSGNDPLRRIVCNTEHPDYVTSLTPPIVNVLECAHYIRKAEDMMGARNPIRRRCPKCRDNKPLDFTIEQVEEWAKEVGDK